jgi:hypothetical protein
MDGLYGIVGVRVGKRTQVKHERQLQQQIPFGDDNKKGKCNGKCKNGRRSFDSVRSLRMAISISFYRSLDVVFQKVEAATEAASASMLG